LRAALSIKLRYKPGYFSQKPAKTPVNPLGYGTFLTFLRIKLI